MGQPVERRRHLLLSAGRPGDRRLRPLSEEEGQEHSFRGARRAWSRSPLRCWTASICARPSATGTKAASTCASSRRFRAKSARVVVIFDEDRDDRYTYMTTWLGEHQNESDMAFYSTFPFDNLVGPGIGRAEYGGFLMSLPPRRMYDVWQDPDYDFAETKVRAAAAGRRSIIRSTATWSTWPPSRRGPSFETIAARVGRTIVYIPIGQLSPVTLKKIRVVHVLDGYDKREIAKDYIW